MTKCTHKQLMTACMLAGTLMLGACTSTPPVTKEVSIVPITNHLEETNGAFVLKSNTSIGVIDAELIPAAEYLADMLSSATGYDLKVKEGEGTITLALGDVQGKEGAYTLTAVRRGCCSPKEYQLRTAPITICTALYRCGTAKDRRLGTL